MMCESWLCPYKHPLKGKRKISEETKRKLHEKAKKMRAVNEKKDVAKLFKEIQGSEEMSDAAEVNSEEVDHTAL